jgi:hypothetical protein
MIGLRVLVSRSTEPDRRTRRLIIGASIVLIPVAVIALEMAAILRLPQPFGLLAGALLIALISLPLAVITAFRRNVMRRSNADERERRRRDEAYRISYRIIEVAVVIGFLIMVGFRNEVAAILSHDAFVVAWPLYGYLLFLPYMVFAWREPDAA